MSSSSLSVVFSGSGGAGAMTAGQLLLRTAARVGYYGLMTRLFGAQVRGGEAASLVTLSTEPVTFPPDRYDLFVALDWDNAERFAQEIPLDAESVVLADPASGAVPAGIARSSPRVVPFVMAETGGTVLDRAFGGKRVNVFAAAAVAQLARLPAPALRQAFTALLGGKGTHARSNEAALEAGIQAADALDLDRTLAPPNNARRWLGTGNMALGLGALRGGVRFVGCYPITPATDVVEFLARRIERLGGKLTLAEDELAAISMVLGASYAGVPAMTVTSGPGLALMSESIGLGVAAEIPAVIIDVMRGGPSTGLPSKSEQSDLNIAIYGGHGDAPRVVLAPTSTRDCAFTGEWAVYLAESLQTPVIVLSDQALGQSYTVMDPKPVRPAPLSRKTEWPADEPFRRYALGSDPVSPMPRPGTPHGQWVGDGLTHNETGVPVAAAGMHAAMLDKRARKLAEFDPGHLWGNVFGDGETAIVAFGSSIGAVEEAARRLAAAGRPVRVIGLRVLSPLPVDKLTHALEGARRIVVVEQNHSAQLYQHLLAHKAIPPDAESIARPGPLPFRPAELVAHLA